MNDPVEDIADALVDFASDLTLSMPFRPSKPEDIEGEMKRERLDEKCDVEVFFVPMSEAATKIGRGGQCLETYTVNMVVFRKLNSDYTRERMAALTRELCLKIRGKKMAGFVWSGQETAAKFDPRLLHEQRQFASLTRFSYAGAG